jgi:alpha-amylase
VGECWDGTSTIRKWIDGTKDGDTPTSAAFDFQFRYTVRNAANNNDWSRLGQQNDGSYPLVSSSYEQGSYRQYAVTFVENHDTEKRSNAPQDPLKKDTLAANAYMLAMPGTPCVFLKHWQAYKQEIKAMVEARKVAGITNTSSYTQMRSAKEYYANLIKTDNENRLIVVVGSNTNGYQPNDQWQEILSGYHYKYYLARKAETAWADKASGSYKEAFSTRLIAVSESDDAQIVYTLDGSEPTSSSKKVSNGTAIPFTEEGDYTLKAGLLLSSGEVKGIITRSYTLKEDKPVEFVIPSFCTMGSDEVCAFFEAPMTWNSQIFTWAWMKGGDGKDYVGTSWPGVSATFIGTADNGYKVFKWTSAKTTAPDMIIFSDGNNKTPDLPFTNGGYYTKDGLKGVVSTGIREIPMDVNGKRAAVYSINGMRLPQGTTADQLPSGVYIINGKKVVK